MSKDFYFSFSGERGISLLCNNFQNVFAIHVFTLGYVSTLCK